MLIIKVSCLLQKPKQSFFFHLEIEVAIITEDYIYQNTLPSWFSDTHNKSYKTWDCLRKKRSYLQNRTGATLPVVTPALWQVHSLKHVYHWEGALPKSDLRSRSWLHAILPRAVGEQLLRTTCTRKCWPHFIYSLPTWLLMMQKGQDERVVTWRSPHRWEGRGRLGAAG